MERERDYISMFLFTFYATISVCSVYWCNITHTVSWSCCHGNYKTDKFTIWHITWFTHDTDISLILLYIVLNTFVGVDWFGGKTWKTYTGDTITAVPDEYFVYYS